MTRTFAGRCQLRITTVATGSTPTLPETPASPFRAKRTGRWRRPRACSHTVSHAFANVTSPFIGGPHVPRARRARARRSDPKVACQGFERGTLGSFAEKDQGEIRDA